MNVIFFYTITLRLLLVTCLSGSAHAENYTDPFKPAHPLYVSVTEFNYNTKENLLEVSCKMFADDCESTLRQQTKTNVDITHPKDVKQLEKLLNDYIQKHLQLKLNGKSVIMQYVGYEKENESVWCYLQVSDVKPVKKLEVTNSLLYDMYNTQISIMHAVVGGNRKSIRINNPDTGAVFEF